jgi:3-dehydroquinate synthase
MTSEPYPEDNGRKDFPAEYYMQRFTVPFDYPVYFASNIFHPQNGLLASVVDRQNEHQRHRIKVFVDSGVVLATTGFPEKIEAYMESHRNRLQMEGNVEIVPGGERAKNNWNLARHVMNCLAHGHLCRHSHVLAIGGGSFLDIVGLAASPVHRGVRLIRAPSTVLAQNDAGVGIKNGIDAHGMKNFAETFTPPFAVLIDFQFLRTLPKKYWTGGIAEEYAWVLERVRTCLF